MTDIVSIYATFADDAEARRIGRQVVEERLAACINILGPCHSIYRWQGQVEEAGEIAAIFKSTAALAPALTARIASLHSYENPAIVTWPISDTTPSFEAWVDAETGQRGATTP